MITPLTVTICGGGSLGLVCSGVFASRHVKVNILTGHPEKWSECIEIFDPDNNIYRGKLDKISSDPQEVIPCSDIVLLCVPGYLIESTLRAIRPYITPHTTVGSIVSSTGFFFMAHNILPPEIPLFGFQRVPFIARVRSYGKTGDLLGYKPSLNVAIEFSEEKEVLREKLEWLFNTPVSLLNSYYEASLTNSNPILHTGRLYSMWKGHEHTVYDNPILFYADWDNESSETIITMDQEFITLLQALNVKDGAVPSLLDYYESTDAESLTTKIRSISAFKTIKAPMIREVNGWIPDFKSRYFTEDFPFGLRYIKVLATEKKVSTPTIDKVYQWWLESISQFSTHN